MFNIFMTSSTKMLQILIDGQAALRKEIKDSKDMLRKDMKENYASLKKNERWIQKG